MADDDDDLSDIELDPVAGPSTQQAGHANPFSPGSSSNGLPQGPVTTQDMFMLMQQMNQMMQASTQAATAAAAAAQAMASRSSGGSSTTSSGLEGRDLLKILPKPDQFKADKPEDEAGRWLMLVQ